MSTTDGESPADSPETAQNRSRARRRPAWDAGMDAERRKDYLERRRQDHLEALDRIRQQVKAKRRRPPTNATYVPRYWFWPANTVLEPDPSAERLWPCGYCGRKAGDGTLGGALKLIKVTRVELRLPGDGDDMWGRETGELVGYYLQGERMCIDRAECEAFVIERQRKREEAAKRRRPDLPHPKAPTGHCKWCGDPIRFDQRRKGWKRRKQRSYHYGDDYERRGQPTDCLIRALAWRNPRSIMQFLLRRQQGRCDDCGRQVAEEVENTWADVPGDPKTYWREIPCVPRFNELTRWALESLTSDYGRGIREPTLGERDEIDLMPATLNVDHRIPLIDGGTNELDNLRVICEEPCHKTKTKREARARASRRREMVEPEPDYIHSTVRVG